MEKSLRERANVAIEELRKRGLSNGSSLGNHSGFNDSVADLIESLLAEYDKVDTVRATLPNGMAIKAVAFDDEHNPAIDIYLEDGSSELPILAFVEFNKDKPEGKEICVGAYISTQEDTTYYRSWKE
jgi:hypothetical protein